MLNKVLNFRYQLIDGGERLLSVTVGLVNFLSDKPVDFHDTIFSSIT